MTTKAELLELAERVEGASGPDRELDQAIMDAVFQPWSGYVGAHYEGTNERVIDTGWVDGRGYRWIGAPRLTASLDSAMALVPEGCGQGSIRWNGDSVVAEVWGSLANGMPTGDGATPALALCAAALRARAYSNGDEG